jgi:pyruvate ferredoxin oxidoreductase gamma subunit
MQGPLPVEIRWHGRGGQGAKTASQLLAMAQMQAGLSVQAFPEYGPERSGAPMQAYNRAGPRPIRQHYGVLTPHYVVVLDDSLVQEVDVAQGLSPGGRLLVNTERSPKEVRSLTGFGGEVWCVPGQALARQAGTSYANAVLLGALVAALGNVGLPALEAATRELLGPKLGQEGLAATLTAQRLGYRWAEGREVA